MGNPFEIVPDSSVWINRKSFSAAFHQDSALYTGMVRSVENDSDTGELRYMVEVHYRGDTLPVSCRMMRRFGGAFNYEDTIMQGYTYKTPQGIAAKAGDHVLVGMLGGQGREGVILGGLTHPTRQSLDSSNGPECRSEFNGIETYINKDGEYTQTFRAQPTNLSDLDKERTDPVPLPKYDTDVGGSYCKWDKTGSFTVCDMAKDPQHFFMDKKNGTIELVSGKVSLKFDKGAQSVNYSAQKYILTCPDIQLGGDSLTEKSILGTTYRDQESQMNQKLSTGLTSLVTSLTQLGNALTAAAAGATGPAAGVAPGLTNAGVAATAMVPTVNNMVAAIKAFEASATSYLSSVVKVK